MNGNSYISVNPYTEEIIKQYDLTSTTEFSTILNALEQSQKCWRLHSFENRKLFLIELKNQLLLHKEQFAKIITSEMGKPLNQSVSEIEKCTTLCDYYSTINPKVLEEELEIDHSKAIVSFKPLGTILLIMPWNFPFWQVLRCAIPALLMGNTILLKHSSNVSGCSLLIEEIFTSVFKKIGVNETLFRTCFLEKDSVAKIISSDFIQGVSLTGSTKVGKVIAGLCGKYVKKCVLELGGSDPYILLEDAELGNAIDACVASRLMNTGQSCISAKRFIVHKRIVKDFTEGMKVAFEKASFADPMQSPTLGTIAREDLRNSLHFQVQKAIESGANCIIGGTVPFEKGYFYPATILTNIQKTTSSFYEELFGPVAQIIEAESDLDAIKIANDSPFGLGGAIFSRDEEYALSLALNHLETGSVAINDYFRSDARLPFGGIKESGFGREMGILGLKEFSNCKTIRFS